MDARNFFASSGPKPVFRQNQYGGSLGGPIRPNKTFFFMDYDGLRLAQALVQISTVPLANGRCPDSAERSLSRCSRPLHGWSDWWRKNRKLFWYSSNL
jgi:hypothetical protein